MARRAATCLPQPAQHRIARPADVHDRDQLLDPLRGDEFRLNTLQRIGMRRAFVAAYLMFGLGQHDHAARGEHDVVVQILRHGLIEAARFFVDRGRRILEIV